MTAPLPTKASLRATPSPRQGCSPAGGRKRREHSRKPDEQLVAGPYLELFSRETKQDWESWGDQVALFDNGTVSTRHHPYPLVDAPTLPFLTLTWLAGLLGLPQ